MDCEAFTSKEKGLLKVASKHKKMAERLSINLRATEVALLKVVKVLPDEKTAEEALWGYAEHAFLWWYGNSARVGERTQIKEYTNKKDETFLAHHSNQGKFIIRVSEEHPEPMPYNGFFLVDRKKYHFVMNREAKELREFFEPILKEEEVDPVPDLSPKKKVLKVARPKVAKPVKAKWDDDD